MFKTAPAVFAVGDSYQIMVTVTAPALFSVRVGDETFYDASNGIMCSLSPLHRVRVPMAVLDAAGGYTVCVRRLIERKPYFTTTEPQKEQYFAFTPVPHGSARAYHIADAHNRVETAVKAAETFGDIDFLILNGDVIDHSGDPSKFDNIYAIAAALTGGHKPVVFSRGNHDMRGNFAEQFAAYTPSENGNTYYTFRLGDIWGLVLDCGEDKPDGHAEYGYTVACHDFRLRQTAFLKNEIEKAAFAADGVKTRLVIVHNPFTHRLKPPFDIEDEIFGEWTRLIREHIRPHAYICGHLHHLGVHETGSAFDDRGQGCPVVVGARPGDNGYFAGCGLIIDGDRLTVQFTDSDGATLATVEAAP